MTNTKKISPRTRTKYTPEQLRALETVFSETQYPDTETMEDLAMKMDLASEKISIWFQNRRSKFKRQSKDSHVTWMRQQIFQQQQQHPFHVMPAQTDVKKTTCHVLTAPETHSDHKRQKVGHTPSSNIHYIPSVQDLSAGSPTCSVGQRTWHSPSSGDASIPSPNNNTSYAPNGGLLPSPNNNSCQTNVDVNNFSQRSLLFSHLLNDQQPYAGMSPGYSWNASPCYGQAMYTPAYTAGHFYHTPTAAPYPSTYTPNLVGL